MQENASTMSRINDYMLALLLAAALLWQLVSARAIGVWWQPAITREVRPKLYWAVLASQCAILVYILVIGTSTWTYR